LNIANSSFSIGLVRATHKKNDFFQWIYSVFLGTATNQLVWFTDRGLGWVRWVRYG